MNKKTLERMAAVAFVAWALGGFATRAARATDPTPDFKLTNLVGPVTLDEIHSLIQTPDYGAMIKTRGLSDVYVSLIKIEPGGHGGWHSHPGPSFITVKSGTAAFLDECDNFTPHAYPAGTGFVEDAACVHLLANEGDVDLEVIVVQIVPLGAPRRIDETAPF